MGWADCPDGKGEENEKEIEEPLENNCRDIERQL